MKKKIFILSFLLCLIFSTVVFASNVAAESIEKFTSDVYSSDEAYTLDKQVNGNVFTTAKDFVMLDTASVSGNLFVGANAVTLKSNVTYSEPDFKDGELSISSIGSKSTIRGNAFIVCKEFTMEPGCEISGDLFIVANKINIQKSTSIGGNLFVTGMDVTINGKIQKSVYASCKSINMNYYTSITNDLHLAAEKANLNSIIHRDAFIDVNTLETSKDFMLYGNLDATTSTFVFSGEVDGNARIKANELSFKNAENDSVFKCLIKGDLDYSTPNELEIKDTIVKGDKNYTVYKGSDNTKPSFDIKEFIISLFTFVIYVFVVVWVFIKLTKNDSLAKISIKDIFVSLGLGLLSIVCVTLIVLLLFLINIGSTLAFVLLVLYVLIILLSIPLFVLDIANLLDGKLNVYLATPLLALALFLIGEIPYVGGFIMFLFTITGTGRIIKKLLTK